jgi:hypothetical protein
LISKPQRCAMASQGKKLINDPNGSLFFLTFFIINLILFSKIASLRSLFCVWLPMNRFYLFIWNVTVICVAYKRILYWYWNLLIFLYISVLIVILVLFLSSWINTLFDCRENPRKRKEIKTIEFWVLFYFFWCICFSI